MMRRQKRGHPAIALAILAFVALGMTLPIVIDRRGDKVKLESADLRAATRDTLVITAPLRLLTTPNIVVERGILTLAEGQTLKPAANGDAVQQLLSSGNAKLLLKDARIVVEQATAPAELYAEGAAPDGAETAPLANALLGLGFESIAIRNSALLVKRAAAAPITLDDVSADISNKRKASLVARGTFAALGQKLSFDTTLGIAPGKPLQRLPLKASIKGALLEANLDGRLGFQDGVGFQGQATLSVGNLRHAARWLGSAWPNGAGLKDFRAKGQLEWTDRAIAFQKASLQMDGNEATGTLSLALGSPRPSLEGTLALNLLDLSHYVSAGGRTDAGARLTKMGQDVLQMVVGYDATDITLPLARELDADIRVSANKVRLRSIELGRTAFTMTSKAAKLIVDVAEFEHDDGRGGGQLSMDMQATPPRIGARGKLSGIDLGRLVSGAIGQQVLYGRGDASFDLFGSGETLSQLTRALNGKANLEVKDGARLGVDLTALLVAPQRRAVEGWPSITRGQTPLEQLTARLVLSQGVVTAETIEATTPDTIVLVGGTANLAERLLDATVTRSRRLASTGDSSEPITIKGPWQAPLIRSGEAQRKAAERSTDGQ